MNCDKNLKSTIERIAGVNTAKCMKCGKCTASCPSFKDMEYAPHKFVDMVNKGQIEKLLASDSIYKCLSCFACVERCPRNVEPAKIIEAIRVYKLRDAGVQHITPNDIPCIIDEEIPQQALVSAFRKFRK